MIGCLFTAALSFLLPVGCSLDVELAKDVAEERAYEEWRRSLDFSFLGQPYAACKLKAPLSASVTPAESCAVSALSKRCSAPDDCLVQCIARGNNGKVGGGCWHLCFETQFNLSAWHEPKQFNACRQLGRINGVGERVR